VAAVSDLEPELLWAALLGLKVATEDGDYPAYHWRDDPSVTNQDRLMHAHDHLIEALVYEDTDDPEHHIEHALADLAIVLARRAGGLP
jgi:hypothetical protein